MKRIVLVAALATSMYANAQLTVYESGQVRVGHHPKLESPTSEATPNLVVEDEEGFLSVDYTGFIPLLVEAYKDLAGKVKEQEEMIAMLTGSPRYAPASVSGAEELKLLLKQNSPNPFNVSTTIEAYVPETVSKAFICVYDLQGTQVRRIDLDGRGAVTAVIDASSLRPGMYVYSLIADGAEADSKRMIITD